MMNETVKINELVPAEDAAMGAETLNAHVVAEAFNKEFLDHCRKTYGPDHKPCWTLVGLADGRLVISHEAGVNPGSHCGLRSLHCIVPQSRVDAASIMAVLVTGADPVAARLWTADYLMQYAQMEMEHLDGVWPGLLPEKTMEA